MAYILASQTGEFDEALKYAQQVKEIAPDNKGVDDTIGWIMYRKGLYRSAVKYLESAPSGAPDPVIRYHLGMAYLKIGDKRGEPTLRAASEERAGLPRSAHRRTTLRAQPGANVRDQIFPVVPKIEPPAGLRNCAATPSHAST